MNSAINIDAVSGLSVNLIIENYNKMKQHQKAYREKNADRLSKTASDYFKNVIKPDPEKYALYKYKKSKEYRAEHPVVHRKKTTSPPENIN